MSSTGDEPRTEDANVTQNSIADESLNADRPPLRRRGSISSFILASFIIFMLMNNRGDEILVRNRYMEALASSTYQLSNYSAWLNGTASNFSLVRPPSCIWVSGSWTNTYAQPVEELSTTELAESLIAFGSRLDPLRASYYSNLTGFWHGELQLQNLTSVNSSEPIPTWRHLADDFVSKLNKSALPERLGDWNWTRSTKVSMSLGDKLSSLDQASEPLHEDIATIHVSCWGSHGQKHHAVTGSHSVYVGKVGTYWFIELRRPETWIWWCTLFGEWNDLRFCRANWVSPCSDKCAWWLICFLPYSRPMDIRLLPSIVPEPYINVTAHVIETELVARVLKLKEKIDAGILDSDILNSGTVNFDSRWSWAYVIYVQLTLRHRW